MLASYPSPLGSCEFDIRTSPPKHEILVVQLSLSVAILAVHVVRVRQRASAALWDQRCRSR